MFIQLPTLRKELKKVQERLCTSINILNLDSNLDTNMEGVMEATVGMPTEVVAITILYLRPASNQCTHCMSNLRIRGDKSVNDSTCSFVSTDCIFVILC